MFLCDVNIFSNLMKRYFTHIVSIGGCHILLHAIYFFMYLFFYFTCFNFVGKGEDWDNGGVIMRR